MRHTTIIIATLAAGILTTGCRHAQPETFAFPEEREDAIIEQANQAYNLVAFDSCMSDSCLLTLRDLYDSLLYSITHNWDFHFGRLARWIATDLGITLLMQQYDQDLAFDFLGLPYLWTIDSSAREGIIMYNCLARGNLDHTVTLLVFKKKETARLIIQHDMETKDLAKTRIDFYQRTADGEDLTGVASLDYDDAAEYFDDMPSLAYYLDDFLELVAKSTTMVISYDTMCIMHSLDTFKEKYYDYLLKIVEQSKKDVFICSTDQ